MAARNLQLARLFYSIEAETKGLDAELGKAEKSLGRLSDFVTKNPVAALGALGAAAVVAAVEVTKMAGEVDAAMRRVAVAVPGATERLVELKDVGRELSTEFGISQTEVAKVMEMVARTGVKSADELIAASRAAVRAQRATGEEFGTIIGLIDTAMDNFGVSADQADAQLAKLIATAKGKISLAELEEVLKAIGPTAKAAGVDFATMVEAVVAVRPTAKNAKDAIAELNNAAAQPGGIEALAEKSRVATDGLKEMSAQIKVANGTIANQSNILREQLNAELIRFGEVILPIAIKALTFFSDLLGGATTKMQRFQEQIRDTAGTEEQSKAVKGLSGAMRELVGDLQVVSKASLGHAIQDDFEAINTALSNTNRITKLTPTNLKDLEAGLTAAAGSGKLTSKQMLAVAESLSKINAAQLAREPFVTPKDTEGLKDVAERLEKIKTLAASGAGLDEIRKALGVLSKAETDAATKAIANHKKAETAATSRAKAETATAKVIIAAVEQIGAKMSETSAGLGKLGDQIRDSYETAKRAQDKVKDGADEIARLQAKINALLDEYKKKQAEAAQKEAERIALAQRLASSIAGLATGLLGAAQAAGILDANTASTLGHIINIAEQIAGIKLSEKSLFDPANLASLAGIIGSLTGILGAIFSGNSAEERARKELIRKNNEVLAELVKSNGELLRLNQPGGQIAGIQDAIAAAFKDPNFLKGQNTPFAPVLFRQALAKELFNRGISFDDFEQLAKDLGFDLFAANGSIIPQQVQKFFEGIGAIDIKFPDTFQGDIDKIAAFIKTGILDPTQEFAGKFAAGIKRSPLLAERFAGVNPFTTEGREQAKQILQEILKDIDAGKIKASDLGGLNGQEFLDFITSMFGILNSDANIKPLTGTEGPNVGGEPPPLNTETADYYSGSIEAAGAQNDLLSDAISIEERQANTLDAILEALLTPTALDALADQLAQSLPGALQPFNGFQPITPPNIPPGVLTPGGVGGGVVIQFGNVTVSPVVAPGADAAAQGRATATAFTEIVDRELSESFHIQKLLAGQLGGGIIRR